MRVRAKLQTIGEYALLMECVVDAAHDVVKSYPMEELYEYKTTDEPLTDEQRLASKLHRLKLQLDNLCEYSNAHPEIVSE